MFWTSFSLSVDDIADFKNHLTFLSRWFDRAGGMKLSLLVEEKGEGVDYDDDFGMDLGPQWQAYEWFLKYSGRWERVVFDHVQYGWLNGLFLILDEKGGLEDCFKNVTHFSAKATGSFDSNTLPLEFMPRLNSLGIQGRGRFESLHSIHAGVWSKLKTLDFGLYDSITKHFKIISECPNLEDLTIRGNNIYWYLDDFERPTRQRLLRELQDPPIVLPKVTTLRFLGVIFTGPFFESLALPSLKSLSMRRCSYPTRWSWSGRRPAI